MAEDMSIFSDVLEPFRKVINTGPPRARLSSVAAKLNFSDQNFSFKTEDISSIAALGKRKSSIDADGTPDKRKRVDSGSSASPAVSSPWEAKRLKIDLIAAKAQITKLESRINHQHSIQKEMTILFEDEKQSFIDQRRRDEKALADMEERLRLIRKREAETKEELAEALRQISENKIKWDRQKEALQKENAELKDKLIDNNISSNDQMSEMKKDLDELSQALEAAQQEIESLQKEVTVQTARASQCSSLRNQLDKQSTELQEATRKLKELEFEQESYKEWQQQAKSAQKRLAALPELERELVRLQSTERGLRDAAHNKLLLEEQVHSLTSRVKALLPAQQQLHQAQVKCATLEASLTEWIELGRARGAAEPRALGAALETAQQKELAATADKIEAESKLAQLREELATAKHEWDKARTKLTDLQHIQKNQESLIHRLQKRLLLVTRERDSYRQQLDCYEKELTVSLTGEGVSGQAGMLSARIQSLEKSLQGYRDLVNKMEQDMSVKSQESSPAMLEQMQRWREEADNLRRENESLRARRDQLETQLEYRALKGDYDPTQTKVLHLSNNPAVAAEKQVQSELEAAQAEIRRLKRRMERLEQEGADASARLSESLRDGAAPQELAQLRQQLESSRIKLQRLKEEFTSSAQEYKDVCYMLLGYKVDRIGHKNYRISSMYAESPEEYLTFTLCDDGIEMVHTEYSATLCDLVELHLHRHHSIPLFLSALTMEQFSRTSEQQEEEEAMVSD